MNNPQQPQENWQGLNVKGGTNEIRGNTFIFSSPPPLPTGDGPPNNLQARGVDRDRFFGRDDVLAELHQRLQKGEGRVAIASVAGMGGVGKSELAVQYAREQLHKTYRGGVVWLTGERAGIELLGFAKSRFFPNQDFSDMGDLQKQLDHCFAYWPAKDVPPESVLLIFDDVTDYRTQVKAILPNDSRFRVLVTTREKIQGIDRLDLTVLDPTDALALLKSIVGEVRIAAEAATAAVICEWLGFLPLGIELVGYYLQRKSSLSLATMLERLNAKRLASKALMDVPATLTAQRGVAAAFELSWDAIGAQDWGGSAQELAMRLSLFAAAPIPWGLMAGCWPEADGEDLEDWRDELVALHLVEEMEGERYQLHPLIREFFAAKLANSTAATAWQTAFAVTLTKIAKTIRQTVTLEQQDQVRGAMPHLEAATDHANLLGDENYNWGWMFVGLARFYEAQSLFEDAERCYQQCLAVSETRFGTGHPHTAASLNNLAALYRLQGEYELAESLYLRALAIRERRLGSDHPYTATSLNSLADLYVLQGKYSRAEPLCQRALAIRERQLGADHLDTAASLNSLARLYRLTGMYDSAEPLCQRALAIRERQLGADHPDTTQTLNSLAVLYGSQGKYDRAEPLYQRALEIRERQLGADHPHTATSLNNLAGLYGSQGKYDRAEPLYQRALEIRERQLGADHPDTAQSLNNLAALYESQGKYDRAEPLYQRALAIWERQLGTDHPHTAASLNNLAGLYKSQGKYDRAEPLHQRALGIREQQLGADHPDTAQSLNNLAALYESQRKYECAEPLYQRALGIHERQLGADHPDTVTSLNNLAALYLSQEQYDRAELLYLRALDISEARFGADHLATATSLNNLAYLYDSQEQYDRAEPLYQRALAIREQQLGADHPSTATSLNNLAVLYYHQNRWGDAEGQLVRALEIFLQKLGETHPDTQDSFQSLRHLIGAALQQGRAAELSAHPLTQAILQQLTPPPIDRA
jgi:tetratricopeptide (TPR) repeat protein